MEQTVGLRERKKRRTRETLIRIAGDLFAKKGFEATTVDEIAEKADVSRSTFFRYFPTKEMVAFPHQTAHSTKFFSLLSKSRSGESPMDTVRRACMEMSKLFMRDREAHLEQWRIIQASPTLVSRGDKFDEEWEEMIYETLVQGHTENAPAVFRSKVFAGAIFGVIKTLLREWYIGDCRDNLQVMTKESLALLDFKIE